MSATVRRSRVPLIAATLLLLAAAAGVARWHWHSHPSQAVLPPPNVSLQHREAELRAAIADNPHDARSHFELGKLYVEQHRFAAAVVEAQASYGGDIDKDDVDALLAWSLYRAGESSVLVKQLKPGKREPHDEAEVRLSLGFAAFGALELDAAEPLLRDAIRLDPNAWLPHAGLARVLTLRRKLPEAREQMAAALQLAPTEAMALRIDGELLRAEGEAAAARRQFDAALQSEPENVVTLEARADFLISQDDLSGATRDVDAALKRGSSAEAQILGALIDARQGDMTAADQLLARATHGFMSKRIGYYLQGLVKFRLNQPETAEYNLAKFQGQQPDISAAARLRATIALQRHDTSAAIAILEPVVKANPADAAAITWLARAYLAAGAPARVLQLYADVTAAPARTAAPPDPLTLVMSYGDATDDLVQIEKLIMAPATQLVAPMMALRQGDIDKAETIAQALANASPNDPAVQDLLGTVRTAQKRYPEAEAIFRANLARTPDYSDSAFNLARVLVAEGRIAEARSLLGDLAQRS